MSRSDDDLELIKRLADQFVHGSIVPVLGAGCSALGFPTANEFAAQIRKQYPNTLKSSDSFYDVTQFLAGRFKPPRLTAELRSRYRPAKSLPIYRQLAKLPIDTVVSFNFDESFEESLEEARIPYTRVVRDSHVTSSRNGGVTVVKPHGTIEQSDTLRATRQRIAEFGDDLPLMKSLLEVLLAERHLLLLGYTCEDYDVVTAIHRVKRWLKDSFGGATAVLKDPPRSVQAELKGMQFDIIRGDAKEVLDEISCAYAAKHDPMVDFEKWRAHPYFADLVEITSRPTETQMLESLIETIDRDIEQQRSIHEAIEAAGDAAALCLEYRANYAGVKKLVDRLDWIGKVKTPSAVKRRWSKYKEERRAVSQQISRQARKCLNDKKDLLLYAESQRVINLLTHPEVKSRNRKTLYISECRHKSPTPYMNVRQFATKFIGNDGKHGFKSIKYLDDMAALHLISERGNFDAILMGVHNVFTKVDDEQQVPLAVVNSVGTKAICMAAKAGNVKVFFVYESDKITKVNDLAEARLRYVPCDQQKSKPIVPDSFGDSLHRLGLEHKQVDYDFVEWDAQIMEAVQEGPAE